MKLIKFFDIAVNPETVAFVAPKEGEPEHTAVYFVGGSNIHVDVPISEVLDALGRGEPV